MRNVQIYTFTHMKLNIRFMCIYALEWAIPHLLLTSSNTFSGSPAIEHTKTLTTNSESLD